LPNRHLRDIKLRHDGPGRVRTRQTSHSFGTTSCNQTKAKLALKSKLKHLNSVAEASQRAGERGVIAPTHLPKPNSAVLEKYSMRTMHTMHTGHKLDESQRLAMSNNDILGLSRSRSGEQDVDDGSSPLTSAPPTRRWRSTAGQSSENCTWKCPLPQQLDEAQRLPKSNDDIVILSRSRSGEQDVDDGSSSLTSAPPTTRRSTKSAVHTSPELAAKQSSYLTNEVADRNGQKRMKEIKARRCDKSELAHGELPAPARLPAPSTLSLAPRLQIASELMTQKQGARQIHAKVLWRKALGTVLTAQCETAVKDLRIKGDAHSIELANHLRWKHALTMMRCAACQVQDQPLSTFRDKRAFRRWNTAIAKHAGLQSNAGEVTIGQIYIGSVTVDAPTSHSTTLTTSPPQPMLSPRGQLKTVEEIMPEPDASEDASSKGDASIIC